MKRHLYITLQVLACSMAVSPAGAEGLVARKLDRDGLKLELAPLMPDQVRAFFLGRGFTARDAEHIVATGCVFRSAIGSARLKSNDPGITVTLMQWRVTPPDRKATAPRTRESWAADWKAHSISEDAATAFYWSLFPTEQTFAATDYNWGFLTFGLSAGTRFDLDLTWHSAGQSYSARMEGLECGK